MSATYESPSSTLRHSRSRTLVERLGQLAGERPGDTALIVVNAQGDEVIDYATLDRRTRALAVELQTRFLPGERALVLLDNDDHYVVAFFACLYAGVIAVPVFPPESSKRQHLERLLAIAEDSQASAILTSNAILETVAGMQDAFGSASLIAVDEVASSRADEWREYRPDDDEIAFLQYTSGSTATPKGVMVSHGNLMANERAIEEGFSIRADDVFVSWLPLYHDMGLIGGLLQPIHRGIPVVLMSPVFFLQRPVRWLQAISRHRGTISGGPDFAYRLCLERLRDEQVAELDLSSWRVAFSGAEPVRHDTLEAFDQRFAPAGFAADALSPCYGLAEATLLVTCNARGTGVVAESFADTSLAQGQVRPAAGGRTLVGCGHSASEHCLEIADPETGETLPDGQVGEIRVAGPSVAQGYWRRREESAATFVERDGARWLCSGDLGFLHQGQLYIAGRIKDLIILRGHNVYPQDLELAVETHAEAVRKGRVAAFAVTTPEGSEGVGVAAEVSRGMQKLVSAATLIEAVSEAVSGVCHEAPSVVLLLNPGALPKTSSGKLQRGACRQGWESGGLDAYAIHEFGRYVRGGPAEVTGPESMAPGNMASGATCDGVETILARFWIEVLEVDESQPPRRDAHFFVCGGNSLAAVQLAARVSEHWQIDVPARALLEKPRFGDLADEVARLLENASATCRPAAKRVLAPISRHGTLPLAPVQRRLWLVDRLANDAEAERVSYNLPALLSLKGELDLEVLERAVNAIVTRHEVLRTRYPESDGGDPIAVIDDRARIDIPVLDGSDLPEQKRQRYLRDMFAEYANTPFDLSTGPLLKAGLLRFGEQEHALVLVIHHIVFDGWSTGVFIREFASFYKELREGKEPGLPKLGIQYVDYAAWHENALSGVAFERSAAFWRQYLDDAPLLSTLSGDFTRPDVTSHAGNSLRMTLGTDLSRSLNRLATERGTTLFTVLLAVFLLLMHRRSGQHDLVVGTDVAGRGHPDLEQLIGFFVNVLPLRSRLRDDSVAFSEWLDTTQESALDAFDHQQVPFDRIVDLLDVPRERSRNPLIQILFVVQNTPTERFSIPGLEVEFVPQPRNESKFDLAVFVQEGADGLAIEWVYATALYRRETLEELATAWQALLQQIVAAPERAIGTLDYPQGKEGIMGKKSVKSPKLDKLNKLASLSAKSGVAKRASPVRTSFLGSEREFPLVVEATDPDLDAQAWARAQRATIEEWLCKHGGILFRNFGLTTPQQFEAFAEAIHPELYGHYGDLPKKEGGRNTYRSTPYPERQMILYHNESSHLERWPRKQLFFCEQPSPIGGATPIVDCREMLRRLPDEVVETFERKGLLYVRTFTRNLDVSWRDFFKTDCRDEVEARLAKAGVEWQWLGDDELQTRTRCPAVVKHPITGESAFFNQVQLHHVSCLDPDVREDLLAMVGEDRLPRNVYYGDGTPIEEGVMALIGETYEACAVRFDWRQGDVVMLDNMLAAHARDPYEGPRKIVVAMGEILERSALDGAKRSSNGAELIDQ
ncbi:condensation domain-containing protein [Halomonas elongata]|uniref:condensation domain-containing protein n=1 Tax=Halomonas elongata TaxID=2746 RepID=UPI0038D3D7B1